MEIHTDLKVLETRFAHLDKSVGNLSEKMDHLLSRQEEFIRLQEHYEGTRKALEMAVFSVKNIADSSAATESKLNKALHTGRGAAIVAVVLFAFAEWYLLQQINKLEDADVRVYEMEKRLIVIEQSLDSLPFQLPNFIEGK
jgi:hypothetical protein